MTLSQAIKDSFQIVWDSPWWVKMAISAFLAACMARSLLFVTTNSLINPEIRALLDDWHQILLAIQAAFALILSAYAIVQKRLAEYVLVGGALLAAIMLCLWLYAYMPCQVAHSSSLTDHVHPHTPAYTLQRSFFCPSYSVRSYMYLLFFGGLGLAIFVGCAVLKVEEGKKS